MEATCEWSCPACRAAVEEPLFVAARIDEEDVAGARCPHCRAWSASAAWSGELLRAQLEMERVRAESAHANRPVIRHSPELAPMVDQLEAALAACPEVELYHRAHDLARVLRDVSGSAPRPALVRILRPPGSTTIAAVPAPHLLELASRAAAWERFDARAHEWRPALPHEKAVEALAARGTWPRLRELRAVIEAPALRPDGSVIDTPGHDAATGLLLETSLAFPSIPEAPSREDARIAAHELLDVLADFPFAAPHDQSAALAALLTLAARPAIDRAPMFVVSAPERGTGKSLLVDVVATIATGRTAPRVVQARDDVEERKLVLALALEGTGIVLLDNVERPLGSDVLAAALTAESWRDRVLGASRTATAPLVATWFATGNNLELRGDLARRCIPIHLDARVEQPEERSGFRFADLLAHARSARPRLVVASLTILRAFLVAGQPRSPALRPVGSFSGWDHLVRHACVWLGLADPAAGRVELRERADAAREALVVALSAWHQAFGEDAVTIAHVARHAHETAPGLRDALLALASPRGGEDKIDAQRLGFALRRHAGRIVGGLVLSRAEDAAHGRVASWRVAVADVDGVSSADTDTGGCGGLGGLFQASLETCPTHAWEGTAKSP